MTKQNEKNLVRVYMSPYGYNEDQYYCGEMSWNDATRYLKSLARTNIMQESGITAINADLIRHQQMHFNYDMHHRFIANNGTRVHQMSSDCSRRPCLYLAILGCHSNETSKCRCKDCIQNIITGKCADKFIIENIGKKFWPDKYKTR